MNTRKTLRDVIARIHASQGDGAARPITIVGFGDSNTRGMAIDPDRHRRDYLTRLLADLHDRYAPAAFQAINAGIPGDTMAKALGRIESDVLRHEPDLVVMGFAVNDAGDGREGLEAFAHAYEDAITRIAPHAALIIMTPGMLATHMNDRPPPKFAAMLAPTIATQTTGMLADYVETQRRVALLHDIPVADTHLLWQALAQSGVDPTALLANGINHPLAYMHDLFAVSVMICLERAGVSG